LLEKTKKFPKAVVDGLDGLFENLQLYQTIVGFKNTLRKEILPL